MEEKNVLPIFFDYGQHYAEAEIEATGLIANRLALPLVRVKLAPKMAMDSHGAFWARNATLLSLVASARPRCIYFGSRNLLPILDRYGDSNWLFARRFSKLFGLPVRTPCTGLPKRAIIRRVVKRVPAWMVYSTEKKG
jgi:hypothetical protein